MLSTINNRNRAICRSKKEEVLLITREKPLKAIRHKNLNVQLKLNIDYNKVALWE